MVAKHPDTVPFVPPNSIVRTIWGKRDCILFIFAGAAAEFALNNAVDWLYVTRSLPNDPLGRLFSTVSYARRIVFSTTTESLRTIDAIGAMHHQVEEKRGAVIPDWAYRDVLFLLIDYSIRAYEVLERKLSEKEKEDVFHAFNRLGIAMNISGLPASYLAWQHLRREHLREHLTYSELTRDLFQQYKKHLGTLRYALLIEVQKTVTPEYVRRLLGLSRVAWLAPLIPCYKLLRYLRADAVVIKLLVPAKYRKSLIALEENVHLTSANILL